MAQLARDLAAVRETADKQLSILQSSVEKLKDVEFHSFYKQLRRQAVTFNWPPHILSEKGEADLTATARDELDPMDVGDLTLLLHIRNAWKTIEEKCDGHQVEGLLEVCEALRAREAMDVIKDYFHPKSVAGKRNALKTLVNSSMASTHNTIIEWIATVRRNSINLVEVGGICDDDMQVSVILAGLLPDHFDRIKHTLDQTDNLSLPQCINDQDFD
jgi:predicted RNA-binding protein with PUA-like domain